MGYSSRRSRSHPVVVAWLKRHRVAFGEFKFDLPNHAWIMGPGIIAVVDRKGLVGNVEPAYDVRNRDVSGLSRDRRRGSNDNMRVDDLTSYTSGEVTPDICQADGTAADVAAGSGEHDALPFHSTVVNLNRLIDVLGTV